MGIKMILELIRNTMKLTYLKGSDLIIEFRDTLVRVVNTHYHPIETQPRIKDNEELHIYREYEEALDVLEKYKSYPKDSEIVQRNQYGIPVLNETEANA